MGKVRRSVRLASEFLLSNGFPELVRWADCDAEMRERVLGICPEYERLAPVMVRTRSMMKDASIGNQQPNASRFRGPSANNADDGQSRATEGVQAVQSQPQSVPASEPMQEYSPHQPE